MTAEIHVFTGITKLDTSAERILDKARGADLTEVVVIGFREDGREFFASSKADGGAVLWQLQRAIHKLMCTPDELSDQD